MKAITILLLVTCFITAKAQQNVDFKQLDATIKKEMEEGSIPGAEIAVMKNGFLVYQQSFGLADKEANKKLKPNMIFACASVTKLFTAAALLSACENKNIDIHAPIGNILPWLPTEVKKISIHHLLSHTAGLVDIVMGGESIELKELKPTLGRAGNKVVFGAPGKVFSYSTLGYQIAGLLLQTIQKKSFVASVDQIILKPLHLKSTFFDAGKISGDSLVMGHDEDGNQYFPGLPDELLAGGGIFSNVEDLMKFAECLMNNGTVSGKQILGKKVVSLMKGMYAKDEVLKQYLGYPNGHYGYGCMNYQYRGINFFGHPGEGDVTNALLVMAPDFKTAFIALSNTGFFPMINSIEKAISLVLPVSQELAPSFIATYDAKEAKLIAGKYCQPNTIKHGLLSMEIIDKGNELYFKYSPNQDPVPLIRTGNFRYKYKHPLYKFDLEIIVYPDDKGNYKYLPNLGRVSIKN